MSLLEFYMGSNGTYEWELDGPTRAIDKIPLIEADKISSFQLKARLRRFFLILILLLIQKQVIHRVAFIDDFEGSRSTTSPSIQRRFWKSSSSPLIYDGNIELFGNEYAQKNRGRLYWFNPYVPVRTKEICGLTNKLLLRAGNETTEVLVLKYSQWSN